MRDQMQLLPGHSYKIVLDSRTHYVDCISIASDGELQVPVLETRKGNALELGGNPLEAAKEGLDGQR